MLVILLAVQICLWAHASTLVQAAASQGDQAACVEDGSLTSGIAEARLALAATAHEVVMDTSVQASLMPGDEVQVRPFSFELDELGYWPSSQVIWYGCAQTPETLHGLAMELRRRLQAAALPHHTDKFVPHVTLARWVRKAGPLPTAQRITWEVRDVVLVRSETLATGVRYTELAPTRFKNFWRD